MTTLPLYSDDDYDDLGLTELMADEYTDDPDFNVDTERLVRRVHGPTTEVWLRGVNYYPWLLKEVAFPRFCWRATEAQKIGRPPYDMLREALGDRHEFSFMVTDNDKARRYDSTTYTSMDTPSTTYPVWRYNRDPRSLLRMCAAYKDHGWDRIVIDGLPTVQQTMRNERARIVEWLYRVNNRFPEVKFHWRYGSVYNIAFGTTFYSVDLTALFPPPRTTNVRLPNGKLVPAKSLRRHLKWVHVLGYGIAELRDPHNRTKFNLASMLWAAENWNNPHGIESTLARNRTDPLGLLQTPDFYVPPRRVAPRSKIKQIVAYPNLNPDKFPQSAPRADPVVFTQPITYKPFVRVEQKQETKDKILCDSCSLAPHCRVYRERSLCSLKESPVHEIVAAVGARDADTVRGVLARLVDAQISRYQRSARAFEADNNSDVLDLKRSKRLSEMESAAIRSTETMLKIVDPEYRDSMIPAIKVGSTTNIYNPRVLVADVMKALANEGIDRSQINPEMILQVASERGVLEGEVVNEEG